MSTYAELTPLLNRTKEGYMKWLKEKEEEYQREFTHFENDTYIGTLYRITLTIHKAAELVGLYNDLKKLDAVHDILTWPYMMNRELFYDFKKNKGTVATVEDRKKWDKFLDDLETKLDKKYNEWKNATRLSKGWNIGKKEEKVETYERFLTIIRELRNKLKGLPQDQTGGRRNTRGLRRKNRKTKRSRLP